MTMNSDKTIASVVRDGLCTNCGTCIALCPTKSIKLSIDEYTGTYVPTVDEQKCNKCGICYKVCPGHETDLTKLSSNILGEVAYNSIIGNYLHCYVGYSNDQNIRYSSSSGGLITQILITALEDGLITGALVTRANKHNPLLFEPYLARSKEEIIDASKSKYCPVPANVALRDILEAKKGEKFAVVGLPCHIEGIRKAELINRELDKKIVLHLGLFCNHSPNFWGTRLMLRKLGVNEKDVEKLDYRGEGSPGYMKITCKNGVVKRISLQKYWNFIGSNFFYPTRCLMCSDGISELADICFGDAWLPEYSKNDKIGTSVVVTKNERSEELLAFMKSKGYIELKEITARKVIRSQYRMLYFKKKTSAACRRIHLGDPSQASKNSDYWIAWIPYLNSQISTNPSMRRLLCAMPLRVVWLYNAMNELIFLTKNGWNKD